MKLKALLILLIPWPTAAFAQLDFVPPRKGTFSEIIHQKKAAVIVHTDQASQAWQGFFRDAIARETGLLLVDRPDDADFIVEYFHATYGIQYGVGDQGAPDIHKQSESRLDVYSGDPTSTKEHPRRTYWSKKTAGIHPEKLLQAFLNDWKKEIKKVPTR
jgi:hypothetical protein